MWKGQERGQGPYYGLEFAFAKCQKGKNEGPDKLCMYVSYQGDFAR